MKTRIQGRAYRRRLVAQGTRHGIRLVRLKGYKGATIRRVYDPREVRVFLAGVEIKGYGDGQFRHIFVDGIEVVEK